MENLQVSWLEVPSKVIKFFKFHLKNTPQLSSTDLQVWVTPWADGAQLYELYDGARHIISYMPKE